MLAASVALPEPPGAGATSCGSTAVVDGRILVGTAVERQGRLPARGARRRAVSTACGAEEESRWMGVMTLRGLPAEVAVAGEPPDATIYVADGTLTAMRDHPLHAAFGRSSGERSRRCRPERRTVRGAVSETASGDRFVLRRGDRTVTIVVDARTRLANRPAWQPLLRGQAVALRASTCGRRRVADEIAFTGRTVRTAATGPREPASDELDLGRIVLVGGLGLLAAAVLGFFGWAWRKTAP